MAAINLTSQPRQSYTVTVDGQEFAISANSKSEARALLKGFRGKPLPPGLDLQLVPKPPKE